MKRLPLIIQGSSGVSGGSGDAPKEHPNTLQARQTARIIDLVSEGEIVGLVDAVTPLKCVYFDNVPVIAEDDTVNFEGVTVVERVGTASQTYVPGFTEIESEESVNQEIKKAIPVIQSISDTDVDAVRIKIRIPALYETAEKGDLVGSSVNYKIEIQPSAGSYTEVVNKTITGKTTGPYEHQHRIPLDTYAFPVNIKVTRITDDSAEATLRNETFWSSYTKITESKLSYPDSAYYAITVDAELFSGGIPTRSFLIKGIKVRVPSNYNPVTRVYTGIWDGTFTTAWSDNPAWVFLEMLTNTRFGLGNKLADSDIDIYKLYEVSQYCDEIIDDGFGGTEPRFTANGTVSSQKEAYEVIQAFASVFRGLVSWSAGGVSVTQDAPGDSVRLFTEANVIGGLFTYSSTGLKARHSAVSVTWNDPDFDYKQTTELIEDNELIEKYGYRTKRVQAFLTTSQGQAARVGQHILDSEKNQTKTVTFVGGFDMATLIPGQVISIADRSMQAAKLGGRVSSASYTSILPSGDPDDTFPKSTILSSVTSWSAGSDQIENDALGTFATTIYIPGSAKPEGVIFELGDSTTGAYVGFDQDSTLIFRVGDGSGSPVSTNYARLEVPYANLEKNRNLLIVWEFRTNITNRSGRVRVWINNQYIGEDCTSDASDFATNAFASANAGGYGTKGGAAIVAGESGSYDQDVETSGVVLVTDLSYWNNTGINDLLAIETQDDEFDPAQTISSVAAWSGADTGEFDRNANNILACAVTLPAAGTTPQGCIFEFGNGATTAQEALFFGFNSDGDLIYRAGQGGTTPDENEYAQITVPASEFTAGAQYHFMVDMQPSTGKIKLWINWKFWDEAQTTDRSAFQASQSAGSEAGSYGQISGGTIPGDAAYALAFNGTLDSGLAYYQNARVGDVQGNYTIGSLVLDQDYSSADGDRILLMTEDALLDSLEIKGGTTGSTVQLLESPTSVIVGNYNTVFIIQGAVSPTEWRTISVRETSDVQFEVTALEHDSTKYDRIEQGLTIERRATSLFPAGPLLPPSELTVTEEVYAANSTIRTRINISWVASPDPRSLLYRVETKPPDSSNWATLLITSAQQAQIPDAAEGVWSFRVTAIMGGPIRKESPVVEITNMTIYGKLLPPGDVTGLTATTDYARVALSWTAATDVDVVGYKIKTGDSWDDGTVVVANVVGTSFETVLDTTLAQNFYVKAVDVVGIESVNEATVTTTPKTVPAITGLAAYQIGRDAYLKWDHLRTVASVKYEIRVGTTSDTWNTAMLFAITEAPEHRAKKSVTASGVLRFRVKAFVELGSGERSYGTEQTFDREFFPVIGNSPTKSQSEDPNWTGRALATPTGAYESITSGTTLDARTAWTASQTPPWIGRSRDAMFRVVIKIPTAVNPEGCIWEMGNSAKGGYLGFNGSYDLVFRAGDGASSWDVNDTARVVVSNADLPSNVDFEIICDIQAENAPGRVRLWIDGRLMGEDTTNDSSAFSSNTWATTNDGQYNGNNGALVAGETGSYGQTVTTSGVLLQSNLEYWEELADYRIEITGSNELTLQQGATYGEYIYDFDHASEIFGNLWYEATTSFIAADPYEIFEATGEIFDADDRITEEINAGGTPQVQFLIQLDGAGSYIPFVESDYSFTTAKIKIELRRGAADAYRPAISSLDTYHNVPTFML
jgi:predicted phage tail protein